MVFITCRSSIGVRKQANPVNENASPIASQRQSQIMPARLSAKYSEDTIDTTDKHPHDVHPKQGAGASQTTGKYDYSSGIVTTIGAIAGYSNNTGTQV
jgi:hypothetical protein